MENDIFWAAIAANDPRFDGAFVYGVRTTGIYCRPSCASKPPKRPNVVIFEGPADAEKDGFRACLRCRPKEQAPSPRFAAVVRACRTLDKFPDSGIDELAAEAGLGADSFRRLFTETVGVTPKKYAEARRLGRFRAEVRDGRSVTDAMYEAGFGSSSRLYENVGTKLGMTPRTYRRGGAGMRIEYAVADCPLGKMLVARTGIGICAVTLGEDADELLAGLRSEYPNAEISESTDALREATAAIVGQLEGKRATLELPLDLRATAFQMRVWEALRRIPYGETASYRQIAESIGEPAAVRAVATACASNRVAIVIPCHRVVRSNGEISGYRWGVERKRRILETEARTK